MTDKKDRDIDELSRSLHELHNDLRAMEGKPAEPYEPRPFESPYCSFCGKGRSEVLVLVEGPSVYICDECTETAYEIVREARSRT